MSTTVEYTGGAHVRTITKANFTSVGVEDQGAIKVAGRNHPNPARARLERTVAVSDAAADWLVANEEFAIVETTADAAGEMTAAELRDALAAAHLPTSGTKTEMAQRLAEHQASTAS